MHRDEDRREQDGVVGVRGTPVGVVEERDIPRLQVFDADVLDPLADGVVVGAEELGDAGRFRDQLQITVIDRDAEVVDLVDDRVERRLDEGRRICSPVDTK